MFNTPVLFLLFNRPDTTEQVFEVIRQVKPVKLFIAADGPRKEREGDTELCRQTRELVMKSIDWDCEVKILFRAENLGCGKAVSEAITWFFEQVDEGIILEDDTLPNLSFFNYCSELLKIYRNNETIMTISGNTFHSFSHIKASKHSYYFSSFPFIWGWATWKRSWMKYQLDIVKISLASEREKWINNAFHDIEIRKFWIDLYQRASYLNEDFTWDYQWFLTIWKNSGKTILPQRNLVVNIGWGANATHTKEENHHLSKLKSYKIKMASDLPQSINLQSELEWKNFSNFYLPYNPIFFKRILRKINYLKRKYL
ncbi:MAG: hypothetical protein K9I82_17155 [Chitinophagaceae bacterium]|nr:hypothetical protein [Chitinophagaceae bacterium]